MGLRAYRRLPFLAAMSCTVLIQSPVFADWGSYIGRSILQNVARQAVNRFIQREFAEEAAPSRETASPNPIAPRPAPHRAHHSYHADAQPVQSQDPGGVDIPPPPPTPTFVPGEMPSASDDGLNAGATAADDLVPPPPPAPSLWNDMGQGDFVRAVDRNRRAVITEPVGTRRSQELRGAQVERADLSDRTGSRRSQQVGVQNLLNAFKRGTAGSAGFDELCKAKAFIQVPMRGGVYKREDDIRYIILHSTETASPADARRVIASWSNRGTRHPGAQFVVDRDGTICATTNPENATIHIDSSRVVGPYSNDNSIGIEIVRSGKQKYTQAQVDSLVQLVSYLQEHYEIPSNHIVTHHMVQPSNRTDPVDFSLAAFQASREQFVARAPAVHAKKYSYTAAIEQEQMPPLAPPIRRR